MTRERPDEATTDEELWKLLVRETGRHGAVVEARPGVIRVQLPAGEPGCEHPVEIRMTTRQLRETVTSLSADGQRALGLADPVSAGWGLFTIHLEENLGTLRAGEGYLLWHEGALRPSADLAWPPRRARESS